MTTQHEWLAGAWDASDTYTWMEKVRTSSLPPLIITCALNGGVQGKEAHPGLPERPEEIATAAQEAYEAGASIVHIHGRDPDDVTHSAIVPDVYQEINGLVRERCPDLIINNTTGGGPGVTLDDRMHWLQARPEMASLNMGPDMSRFRLKKRPDHLENPREEVIVDECVPYTYGFIEGLAEYMLQSGIKPELEIYQPGQYWTTRALIERELLEPPYIHQFVMGYQTSSFPTASNVCALIDELPENSIFFVCGVGPFQLPMTTLSILLGGHVRVGLEDNLYRARGQLLEGNGEAVERVVRIAGELNRDIAGPAVARKMLGLPAEPRSFELRRSRNETR